jgi:hypothetical protein
MEKSVVVEEMLCGERKGKVMCRHTFLAALFALGSRALAQVAESPAPQCAACLRFPLTISAGVKVPLPQVFDATGPLYLRILNAGGDDDGSTLSYPVTVCSTCGALFAVRV